MATGVAEAVVGLADDRGSCHRRMALQGSAHVVGHHFEPAANDGLVGAPKDPQEPVRVDARHVGGPHPIRGWTELARFDLEQADHLRA